MTYRNRKRLAALALVLGLPAYIMTAVWLVDQFDRPPVLVELAIYVGLGVLWTFPLKPLFRGIGKPDPDAAPAPPAPDRRAPAERAPDDAR